MRGGVAGDNFEAIGSVGKRDRVEGVEAVGDFFFKRLPVGFAVSAIEEREDKLIAVVIVRGPARRNRGFIANAGKRLATLLNIELHAGAWRRGEVDGYRLLLRNLCG